MFNIRKKNVVHNIRILKLEKLNNFFFYKCLTIIYTNILSKTYVGIYHNKLKAIYCIISYHSISFIHTKRFRFNVVIVIDTGMGIRT